MIRRITDRAVAPPPPPPDLLQQLGLLLRVELLPLWLFWQNLRAMSPWWPLLLPLLAVYFVRTYRRERREVLARRARKARG
jgi:hypothetical protein